MMQYPVHSVTWEASWVKIFNLNLNKTFGLTSSLQETQR